MSRRALAGLALGLAAGTLRAGEPELYDRCGWRFPAPGPIALEVRVRTPKDASAPGAGDKPTPTKPAPAASGPSSPAHPPDTSAHRPVASGATRPREAGELFDAAGPVARPPLRAWTGEGRPED